MIFYYTVFGPFYRSRVFMRTNLRMSFDRMHFVCFSFAFTWNKISDVIGLNRFMYLHLNQPSSEPVYLINDGIKMIAQKVFVNYQKRNYDVSLIL